MHLATFCTASQSTTTATTCPTPTGPARHISPNKCRALECRVSPSTQRMQTLTWSILATQLLPNHSKKRPKATSFGDSTYKILAQIIHTNICAYVCIYIYIYISIYLSIYLSTYVPTYISIYLSIYLSI